MEERLAGGRNEGAVRVGDTVRRQAGRQTPAVQALLAHLGTAGFTRAPRPLGVDEQGREVLSYLEGETIGVTRPWPAWARSDEALTAAGQWLRDFHVASRTFTSPPDAVWFGGRNGLRPGEIIGHHDAAPYNAVWVPGSPGTPGRLVGFIDWDLAHPALPIVDLAFVALSWVPLTAPDVAAGDGFAPDLDRSRRLRLLLTAYGWTGGIPEVVSAARARAIEHATGLRQAARDGWPPAVELVDEGVADDFDRAAAGITAEFERLVQD